MDNSLKTVVVAVTGGIGSGKSTVTSTLEWMGYKVYNSDYRAAYLMEHDLELVKALKRNFSEDIYQNGVLNRKKLAAVVFGNSNALQLLNATVHPAVFSDLERWKLQNSGEDIIFVESAIVFESGLSQYVDKVITISAPEFLRVDRVIKRDNTTKELVEARIKAQMDEKERHSLADYTILCDDKQLVIPQLLGVIANLLTP